MNSHIEPELILTLGNKIIDVSNVSVGKKNKHISEWDKEMTREDKTVFTINEMVSRVGVDLIKQEYSVLRLRMGFFKAITEIIKRSFINKKLIDRCNKEEFEEFQGWVYEQMTGNKKKDLETDLEIMKLTRNIYQKISKDMNLSPEQCSELLMMSVKDQMNDLKKFTEDPKVS